MAVTSIKTWQKVKKMGITMGERAGIENAYLTAPRNINMCSHTLFLENPLNGLGGIANPTFSIENIKGAQLSP